MDQQEFEAIMSDQTKRVDGHIDWELDEDKSPSLQFKVPIESDAGWPLTLKGTFNRKIGSMSFVILHGLAGRIYCLDLGKDHKNPDQVMIGRKHKHRWTTQFRDKQAYVPEDITAPPTSPLDVWQQFCVEAKITHNGHMLEPPNLPQQPNLNGWVSP